MVVAKIRKAVLPIAGLGTRLLPVTKTVPKELLPLVDVPAVQIVVEECVASGIEEIVFVISPGKDATLHHFAPAPELEALLQARGKSEDLARVRHPNGLARIRAVVQAEPRGLGHAVACARDAVGDEPFAVVLPDDIMVSPRPALRQLVDEWEASGEGAIGLYEVAPGEEHLYGVVAAERAERDGVYRVSRLVEKPAKGTAPSRLAIVGRYVLPSRVLSILDEVEPGRGDEIQLTDALGILREREGLRGVLLQGERYDTGDRAHYVLATLRFALARSDLASTVRAGIAELLRRASP